MNNEEKYLKLLQQIYLSYLKFDKAINANERNQKQIEIAYTWLDSNMSLIFDEIGNSFEEIKD